MYKFAICDDEPADLAYVKAIVEQWGRERKSLPEIQTFPSAESFHFGDSRTNSSDTLI